MNAVLEFRNVERSFKKGKPVLRDVSFSLEPGEVVGLLGQNGAGKTTLIRLAMGMLFPDRGSVRVFGMDPKQKAVEVKRRLGFVAEDQILPPSSSIAELVGLHKHLFPNWDGEFERELLDMFGLSLRSKVGRLSKGQARQVALLCAMCHRPELLLLDEPAGGLDPAIRRSFLEASIQLLSREGTTILYSSHYMGDVERLGARIVLLAGGKVRLDAPVDYLRERVCLAVVPRATGAALENTPGVLNHRLVRDDSHLILEGSPDEAYARLNGTLDTAGVRCTSLPLEDLFIEFAGQERREA